MERASVVLGALVALSVMSCGGPQRMDSGPPSQPSVGLEVTHREGMVRVPAGSFIRGRPDLPAAAVVSSSKPAAEVWIDAFWIDAREVTVGQYLSCVQVGSCNHPVAWQAEGSNWDHVGARPGRLEHPANGVSWEQAQAFCFWAGKRLPTEAEWEKAALGTDGRRHPWGNQPTSCRLAVVRDARGLGCGEGSTAAVGSLPEGVSPYGAYDMQGNVWEWVADWYHHRYYAMAESRAPNPQGPALGANRVVRGWSYGTPHDHPEGLYLRELRDPATGHAELGFRCAASP